MDDKPKLYSKGTLDQVELNKYIDTIRNGYNEFERSLIGKYYINQNGDKVKIKEKHIPMIRNAYSDMLRRVASGDDTFLAKIEGGFLDKTGKISNIDSFDNYGIIASYFGNVLRNMDSYTEPTVAKAKYTKDTLGKEFTKRLLGNSSPEYFIKTDEPDENGVISTKNRTESTKIALQSLLDDLKNKKIDYEGYTDEQRTTDISNIENLFSIFGDNEIKENEYFQLGKILGLNNLNKLYSTSEKPTDNLEIGNDLNISNFYKHVLTNYSVPSNYTIRDSINLSVENENAFSNDVKKQIDAASTEELYTWLNAFLEPDMTIDNESKYVINQILTRLNNNGEFQSYGEGGPNIYYIPKLNTNNNTGFIWDSSNNILTEKPLYDIDPYFLNYIYPQYGQSYPDVDQNIIMSVNRLVLQRKKGGILYAENGSIMNRTSNWLNVENNRTNAYNTSKWDGYYNLDNIFADIQSNYDKSLTDNTVTLPWGDLSALDLADKLNQLNGINLPWEKTVNAKGYKAWNDLFDSTGFNYYFDRDTNRFDLLGPTTWNRNAFLEQLKTTYTLNNALNIGDNSLYFDPAENKWKIQSKFIDAIYKTVPDDPKPEIDKKLDLNEITGTDDSEGGSDIYETDTYYNRNNTNFQSIFDKYSPDILNTARLWLSINTNNRIADTIRPAYDPTFLNTYERFSPITGNWYLRSKYYQDAANLQSKFSTPTTSDASLYTNTMLDASNIASRTRLAGDVADNAEIKKTADEALKRVEDNMKRRSDIANTNRDRMAKSDLLKAELEAMRINKNWKSIDNWISGMEDRMRAKLLETKDFAKTVATDSAKRQYDEMISPAKEALMNWEGQKEGNTLANWDLKNKYLRFMEAAATRYPSLQLSALSGVLGTYYDNPYKEPLNWYTFNKNGGVLNRKNDFITQIIKLNNERNS